MFVPKVGPTQDHARAFWITLDYDDQLRGSFSGGLYAHFHVRCSRPENPGVGGSIPSLPTISSGAYATALFRARFRRRPACSGPSGSTFGVPTVELASSPDAMSTRPAPRPTVVVVRQNLIRTAQRHPRSVQALRGKVTDGPFEAQAPPRDAVEKGKWIHRGYQVCANLMRLQG